MVPITIPIQTRHPKASPRRDHSPVALGLFGTLIQNDEVLGFERINSIGIGFKVINQAYGIEFELFRQLTGIDDPRKIGDVATPVANRSGHAKACAYHRY